MTTSLLIKLFVLSLTLNGGSGEERDYSKPPKVFSNFGYDFGRMVEQRKDTAEPPDFPRHFWSLYQINSSPSTAYGAYSRDSPSSWRNFPVHSSWKSWASKSDKSKKNILNLSSRPRVSHGPRRRRNSKVVETFHRLQDLKKVLLFDIPLYCWKVLINCRKYKNHVCCPVMPDFMKKRDKRDASGSSRPTYLDPLFGIPLSKPAPDSHLHPKKRIWSPTSLASQRCPVDCITYPNSPCCSNPQVLQDRIAPIGPFVQPTLLENWVSALFELFGNDPFVYIVAKKALMMGVVACALLLWTYLGNHLGILKLPKVLSLDGAQAQNRIDLLDETEKLVLDVQDGNWMDTLIQSIKSREALKNVNKFLCCFVAEDEGAFLGKMECYPTRHKNRWKSKRDSTIDCLSNLVYDITLNKAELNDIQD